MGKNGRPSTLQRLNIRTIPISQIKRAAYNPRRAFTKAELKSFEAELDKFSCVEPLIWNERTGNLVGGHKRLDWLGKRGAKEVEVNVVNLPESEEKLLNLALNRQGQELWDEEKLALVLEEFNIEDIELTGFDDVELQDLGIGELEPEPAPEPQIDKAEELQKKWKVKTGQVWEIPSKTCEGKTHRIMCGDSTKEVDVKKLMQGEKADAVVTDPPYGLGKVKSFNNNQLDYVDDKPMDLTKLDLTVPFVIWGGQYYEPLPMPRNKIGWIVWDKRPDLEGEKRERADRIFGQHFEIAITNISALRGKILRYRWGGYYGSEDILHKTQKSLLLIQECVSSIKGLIVDWFLGSGTTLIACEQLGRICYGMEIEPKYVAVTLQRAKDMGLKSFRVKDTHTDYRLSGALDVSCL